MSRCILVFGMPRSGTTWVGKLFDSHPDTLYRHEPDSLRRLSMPLFPDMGDASAFRTELQGYLAQVPKMRSPEVVGKQPLFPKSYLSSVQLSTYRASVLAAKLASRLRRHFPAPYRPTADSSSHTRLVWKSIESMGRLGVCVDALPSARAIHLMRHPCGYVASVLRGEAAQRFSDVQPSANDLWLLKMLLATPTAKRHRLDLDEIAKLRPEERLAWRWVLMQEKVLADIGHSERVLTLRYEDICAEPVAMTQRMFQFTGLDWHPQSERFVQASTQEAQSGYYSVFKNPLRSAERWRSELPPEVINKIQVILSKSSISYLYPENINNPVSSSEALS
ncbi:sulfotransferase [Oleiagrimonas sp. C23AA]|uniref:sulfotransferase n=1 Tax=Oleiagrimonas sp. C23AA TaxID=2719047 RepID=UPI0014214B65|nr:sulfotransferase [Oleiagrimonas sp. C23AA]NII11165.1 hypothetical protein [Oleiagrimonas sp. C23AA]